MIPNNPAGPIFARAVIVFYGVLGIVCRIFALGVGLKVCVVFVAIIDGFLFFSLDKVISQMIASHCIVSFVWFRFGRKWNHEK